MSVAQACCTASPLTEESGDSAVLEPSAGRTLLVSTWAEPEPMAQDKMGLSGKILRAAADSGLRRTNWSGLMECNGCGRDRAAMPRYDQEAGHCLGMGGVASAVPSLPDPSSVPGCRWPSYKSLLLSVQAYSMISQSADASGMI